MDWGKQNRWAQITKNGRCFFLAMDHGYFLGPTRCLEKPAEMVTPLLPFADALFLTRGVLRASIDPNTKVPIILRVSGGSSVIGGDLAQEAVTVSIDEVLRLNAAAVGLSVFIGSDYEFQTLSNLSNLINACEPYGIPTMAVTAVGKELEKRDARYLSLCCRIAAELGATAVKTYWCEDFHKVAETCPVPVVIAGGPKCDTILEVYEFVYDGLERGAIGVNLGRNVWQDPHPVAAARGLQALIHEKLTPAQANDLYQTVKSEGVAA
ncbi:3-hydroxy-5-phosphonooxypentane-2,4-dione thiolase [Candidatus Viridilinea mediisalina]|uniref:3-hydroxy-5-phosphonooxypentane-2,4-dione thiolase LsrF n=1 Tax=Candidatus Viridilinea mediisalina TaxID=2024553 RepID=A0A2A6RMI5_9CHLR|nr:3-hydroxy-5-phosphonooxypentane-2,4-dione thiolase [Candidatus Viridilinea mediisalina]PDW04069.1 3-hydroxy-5-phosphonooxypentane-2,4-dione thiolase LsrF [Candidatus Viridilinea mediisalina]